MRRLGRPTYDVGGAHRVLRTVERSLSGVILDSPQTALAAVERTRTQTGLTVKARMLDRVYEVGRKCFCYIGGMHGRRRTQGQAAA